MTEPNPRVGVPRSRPGWTRPEVLLLATLFAFGVAIRVVLWPFHGFVGDLDEFVGWVHLIAINGIRNAYDLRLSFPPVITYLWGLLAAVDPAFRTATDSTDTAIRVLMKAPASIADLLLAGLAVAWFRERPRRAIVAAGALLLLPFTWYISAWWGQYDPVFVLPAVAAVLAARSRRLMLAAGLIAISVMTKPQAIPLLIPFVAWAWGVGGLRAIVRAGLAGAAVVAVLWIPFLPDGPVHYIGNLGTFQNQTYAVISLNAWNAWWPLEIQLPGMFHSDQGALLGPVTPRLIGFVATAGVMTAIFLYVRRRPDEEQLALGMGAAALTAFSFLTTMHERYAYAGVVLLVLLLPHRRIRSLWLVATLAFMLNLIGTAPPSGTQIPGLEREGVVSLLASIAMVAVTIALVLELRRRARLRERAEADQVSLAAARLPPAVA